MTSATLTPLAEQRFREGYSCSEAVASVFAARLNLDEDALRRAAAAFGGGIGGMGQTCGAVTGAVMAIGMALAPDDPRNAPGREPVKKMVQTFMQRFESQHGSTLCRDILGCDLGSEGGYAQAREQNLFKTVCPAYVTSATDILQDLMED